MRNTRGPFEVKPSPFVRGFTTTPHFMRRWLLNPPANSSQPSRLYANDLNATNGALYYSRDSRGGKPSLTRRRPVHEDLYFCLWPDFPRARTASRNTRGQLSVRLPVSLVLAM